MKKICTGCRRNRKIGKFARDASRKDGKRIYCRDCISIINKKYRNSPKGRFSLKKGAAKWRNNNKAIIKKYNKAYYIRKRNIILYNKRSKAATESILIFDNIDNNHILKPKKSCFKTIIINPKRERESNHFSQRNTI